MGLVPLRDWLNFVAEWLIVVILLVEFFYDYWWNTRENRIKRRKASAKKTKEPNVQIPVSNPTNMEQKQRAEGYHQESPLSGG
jgi:hypothetical protein